MLCWFCCFWYVIQTNRNIPLSRAYSMGYIIQLPLSNLSGPLFQCIWIMPKKAQHHPIIHFSTIIGNNSGAINTINVTSRKFHCASNKTCHIADDATNASCHDVTEYGTTSDFPLVTNHIYVIRGLIVNCWGCFSYRHLTSGATQPRDR